MESRMGLKILKSGIILNTLTHGLLPFGIFLKRNIQLIADLRKTDLYVWGIQLMWSFAQVEPSESSCVGMSVSLSVFNILMLTFSALSGLGVVKTCPRLGPNWFIYRILHYLGLSLLTSSVGWYRILISLTVVLNSRTFERLQFSRTTSFVLYKNSILQVLSYWRNEYKKISINVAALFGAAPAAPNKDTICWFWSPLACLKTEGLRVRASLRCDLDQEH